MFDVRFSKNFVKLLMTLSVLFSYSISAISVAASSAHASEDLASSISDSDNPSSARFSAEALAAWVWQKNPGVVEIKAALDIAINRIEPAASLEDLNLAYAMAPRTLGRAGQGLNQKIELSQKIPWPGTLAARESIAKHNADMAHRDIELLRLALAHKAKAAYAEWYYIQQALVIHHAMHELLIDLKAVAQTRYAVGKSLQQDALQASLAEAELDRHLLRLKRIQQSVKARINALLNQATDSVLPKAEFSVGDLPMLRSLPTLTELEQDAMAIHPDLRKLDSQISAHRSEVTLAEKSFYPDVRLTAGYNSLWDEADKRPTIGFSLNIPFDRSKRKAELRRAKAGVARAHARRDNLRTELMGEIAQAYAALTESIEAVSLYEKSLLPLATEYAQAALADYQSGAGSFYAVITAEQTRLDTQESLERNRADVLRNSAELEHWIGGPLQNSNAPAGIEMQAEQMNDDDRSSPRRGEMK